MEDKDLPEIGFREKKERKGFLPWLQGRLGIGARGSMGSAGASPAAGVGAARLGAGAKFGAAGGLLAAKGTISMVAVVAAVLGATFYMNNQGSIGSRSSSFDSDKAQSSDYVPAILRRQASPGSSLDMFADRNKGAIDFDGKAAKAKAAGAGAAGAEAETEAAPGAEQDPDNGDMVNPQDALGKLQGAGATGLSTSLSGGGSGKMMMGGMKTGQGAFGPKVGFTDMGAGKFAPMQSPRKGKVTAMGASRQAVKGSRSASAAKKAGGAFNQANAVRDVQRTYSAANIDSMRSTQDQAWEGATGEGGVSGAGLGTGDGGAGIVTSPSLDNAASGGGAGDYNTPGEYNYEPPTSDVIGNPWDDLASEAMTNIFLAGALALAGGWLISTGMSMTATHPPLPTVAAGIALVVAGVAMCLSALYLSIDAMLKGYEIMDEHGQKELGLVYVVGGIAGVTNAVLCMGTGFSMTGTVVNTTNALWAAGVAGIAGLLGALMNAPAE